MTPADLQAALDRGAWVAPAATPSPVLHVSAALGCSDEHAVTVARAKGLIGADGMLRCWNCSVVTDWHVSLHCTPCRVESKRTDPERRRSEWLSRQQESKQEQEQSRPVARVGGRSFRDGY